MSDVSISRFTCLGGRFSGFVCGPGPGGEAAQATALVRRRLLEWHGQFSRFEAHSELTALNRDPRETVPVSPMMLRLLGAAIHAARLTGGLVDPTLLGELVAAGYRRSRKGPGGPSGIEITRALAAAPPRRPASPRPDARWREIRLGRGSGTVSRPPGLQIDLCGVANGTYGDLLATGLAGHHSFVVDAAGDVRFGGQSALTRSIAVTAPAGDEVLHTFDVQRGAAATSGIGGGLWSDSEGRPAHHLLDPATGRPAFTGLVQVTALATTGLEAELRAKAALLCGPARAPEWLPDGGMMIQDDGVVTVYPPSAAMRAATRAGLGSSPAVR
jgi:thiamine biosynthesis lipoprotein